MSSKKKLIADLLFGVQIIGAFVLAGSQFFRLLDTTKGQLLSMFLGVEAFLCFNFLLAVSAHRAQPNRVTRQILWTYVMWLVLMGTNIVAVFLNGNYRWSQNDTRTTTFAVFGTLLVFALMKIRDIGFQDPMPKSLLAMSCKALPQFLMALEIAQRGGAGVPAAAIIAGNVTIFVRIGQLWFAIREAGLNRNLVWLCASEVVNEVSWATVSIVWFFTS
jgi:hypothetical protein